MTKIRREEVNIPPETYLKLKHVFGVILRMWILLHRYYLMAS